MKLLSPSKAAPLVACVLAAAEVQDRLYHGTTPGPSTLGVYVTGLGRAPDVLRIPCAADFGLSAREAGMWGRLRAAGLSERDAADVVKAARMNGEAR